LTFWFPILLLAITCVLSTQMGHAIWFYTFTFQDLSNDIRNFFIQWVLTLAITFWKFKNPWRLQLLKWDIIWECGVHSLTLSYTLRNMKCDSWTSLLVRTFESPYFGHEPKARVVISEKVGNTNLNLQALTSQPPTSKLQNKWEHINLQLPQQR
jgi:hypothetical protein